MMSLTTLCLLASSTIAAPVENVAVEIDASSIKPEGPGITRQLIGKVTSALADQGVSIDEASTRQIRIEVRETSFISYEVKLVISVDGAIVEPGLEDVLCERCPLARMDAAVVAKLPDAIALMERATEPEPAVAPMVAPELVEQEQNEEDGARTPLEQSDEPARERRRWNLIGPVGITGITVGTGGLLMVAAGVVKLASPPVLKQDPGAHEYDISHDPERTGRILVGVGAATAIVGSVLLAVDLTVLRRKRSAIARMPVVVPGIGSLMLEGRF